MNHIITVAVIHLCALAIGLIMVLVGLTDMQSLFKDLKNFFNVFLPAYCALIAYHEVGALKI